MPTIAELQSGLEYDVDYDLEKDRLAEFDAEEDRAGQTILAAAKAPEVAAVKAPEVEPEVQRWTQADPRMPSRRWPIFLPLAAAVLGVSAVVGLAAQTGAPPALPIAPVSWAGAGAPLAAIPVPDVPEAPVRARVPVPATASAEPAAAPAEPMRGAITSALAVVSSAYRALDAGSLRQVWPGADAVALSQRFSTLKYQSLSFDRCDLQPVGTSQVVASCEASVSAVANAGDPALRRRHESWSLVFNRAGDRYVIGSVTIR